MKDRCRQAASGAWYARATWTDPLTGHRRYRHVSAPTQAKCAAALITAIADGRSGRAAVSSPLTVGDLLRRWLESKRGRVRESTWTAYESRVRTRLLPVLGTLRLAKASPAAIQRAYVMLAEQGTGGSTFASCHRILHNAFALAEKQGMVPRNPVSLVDPPSYRAPEADVWTAADAGRFLAHAANEPVYGPLMALALYTGLRQGELLALRWRDIDLDTGVLRVRAAAYRGKLSEPKTTAGRRAVALSPDCLAMLRSHHAERARVNQTRPDCLLFSRPDGSILSYVTVRKRFLAAAEAAGVPPIRFHALRHTHATLMLQAAVHPKIVQERLGHSSIAITLDRYSHHAQSLQAPAALALDAAIRAKSVQHLPSGTEESA